MFANNSMDDHITQPSHLPSDYISTSKTYDKAAIHARKGLLGFSGVVRIDLYDLAPIQIRDVSSGQGLTTQSAKNKAIAAKEVLVYRYVPAGAIKWEVLPRPGW